MRDGKENGKRAEETGRLLGGKGTKRSRAKEMGEK